MAEWGEESTEDGDLTMMSLDSHGLGFLDLVGHGAAETGSYRRGSLR